VTLARKPILWALLGMSFTGVLAGVITSRGRNQPGRRCPACVHQLVPPNEPLSVMFTLPAFSLTERDGSTVTLNTLAGQVWIADFIFTSCPGPCPQMTQNMADLQNDLADAQDLRLVTITVDPKRDTPERLRDYASKFRAHPKRWLFLTGEPQQIFDLSIKGFRLSAPGGDEKPSADHPIIHSTRFVLVDREGRIRGYYDGRDRELLTRLRADARSLLRSEPPTRVGG